ncbi:hypothetical protein DWB85_15400, partial [Seongchinamella sediminis]
VPARREIRSNQPVNCLRFRNRKISAEIWPNLMTHEIFRLEDHEIFQLMIGSQRAFRVWEEAFYMHRDGYLDSKNWDGMNRQFQQFYALPSFQYTWKARGQFYGDEFRHMVENAPKTTYSLGDR